MTLPAATRRSFWLNGSAWEYPSFDNAETFVDLAGYFDQAHLTKSLKYRIGQTPAEIVRAPRQLSFLYKTAPLL